jgi:hypothetical protein
MQLLFYKNERRSHSEVSSLLPSEYNILIEARDSSKTEKDYENDLNQIQLSMNGALRAVLSFEESSHLTHYLIMQVIQTDNLYLITKLPQNISEQYNRLV